MTEEQVIIASTNVKTLYRDWFRKYFAAEHSFGLQYIKEIVQMLLNFKELNDAFVKECGQQKLDRLKIALNAYDSLYYKGNLIHDNILKLQEKDSNIMRAKIDQQNKKFDEIALLLPATSSMIWGAFVFLVNKTDLKNIAPPKDPNYTKRQPSLDFLGGQ